MNGMMNDMAVGIPTTSFCQPTPMMGSDRSGGMIMYMDGFQSTLLNSSSKPCLNLYNSNWTLDTKNKFILAMIVVTCLGISVDGISWYKRRYLSSLEDRKNNKRRIIGDDNTNYHNIFTTRTKVKLSMFQFLQLLIGYILMLSTMTYSIELLLCTITGLTIGSNVFGKNSLLFSKTRRGMMTSSSSTPVSILLEQFDENEMDSSSSSGCHDINDYVSLLSSAAQQRRTILSSTSTTRNIRDVDDIEGGSECH